MYEPKICGFPRNENVKNFIQNLLENEENNEIGIVKVSKIRKLNVWCVQMCIPCGRKCNIQSQVQKIVLIVCEYENNIW